MSLFSECYSDQAQPGADCAQSGCGLANIGSLSLEPIISDIKKGILSASQSVLKQLRKKQAGSGVRKRKAVKRNKKGQQGGGKRRQKRKKQTGFGRQLKGARKGVQQGKGVQKRKSVQKGRGVVKKKGVQRKG